MADRFANRRDIKFQLDSDTFFYQGEIYTCRYYFSYRLNKIYGLAKRLTSPEAITVEMDSKYLQAVL